VSVKDTSREARIVLVIMLITTVKRNQGTVAQPALKGVGKGEIKEAHSGEWGLALLVYRETIIITTRNM
jgi:hypothetical protein